MIDGSIMKGTYVETTYSTLKEVSQFQDFLYRNFRNYERYKDMEPHGNQTARLYGTTKIHKFEFLEDITLANLKFQPNHLSEWNFYIQCGKSCIGLFKTFI